MTAAKLDPDLCRAMAAAILTGGLSVGRSLLAEQLNAAVHLADEFASATAARDAQFVALRKALHVRLAEVQLLHAVVVAADAWRDDPCKGLGSHKEADLAAAVDYYRAQQRITPALERAAVAITGQPAAALTEQIKPATASIGPADTAVIVEALDGAVMIDARKDRVWRSLDARVREHQRRRARFHTYVIAAVIGACLGTALVLAAALWWMS